MEKSHRGWLVFFVLVVVAGYGGYASEVRHAGARGASGGSAVGLIFGILAAILLVFAFLRAVRRRLPARETLGSAELWSRAHLWLGGLVLPLAWYHGGFRHGGSLTSASMWLLYGVVVSGIFASVVRYLIFKPAGGSHFPELSAESVEIAVKRLAAEAEDAVTVCGPLNGGDLLAWRSERQQTLRAREVSTPLGEQERAALLAVVASAPAVRSEPLKEFYLNSVKPYLELDASDCVLATRIGAERMLRRYRSLLPEELHAAVTRLERICDDCRRLRSRHRVQRWIDGWMLVHVPLSVALVILVALHGVYAIRY